VVPLPGKSIFPPFGASRQPSDIHDGYFGAQHRRGHLSFFESAQTLEQHSPGILSIAVPHQLHDILLVLLGLYPSYHLNSLLAQLIIGFRS